LPAVAAALVQHPAPAQAEAQPFVRGEQPKLKLTRTLLKGEQATQLAFTQDGRHLVAIDYSDYHIRVWDWQAGTLSSARQHDQRPSSLALDADGSGVWVGTATGGLSWWPLQDGRLNPCTVVGSGLGSQLSLAISPNGRLLATVSYEKTLSLWDVQGRQKLAQIETEEHLRACAFSPDGTRLVVGTTTNLLLEYTLTSGRGRKVKILPLKPEIDLMTLAFSPDGKHFSTGHNQPWITVWDGENLLYKRWLKCPETGGISAIAYSRDSALLAFHLTSGETYLWQPDVAAESGCVVQLAGSARRVNCLAFSRDGAVLAAGDDSGAITLWQAE